MNALADQRVARYLNDNFVSTYQKVGAFKIIRGQKVGGNVASYFCLPDGTVIHAVAGQVDANKMRQEAVWATDMRKSALTFATSRTTDRVDAQKLAAYLRKAHGERYHDEARTWDDRTTIPVNMPLAVNNTAKTHWLLAKNAGQRVERIYPTVWTGILNETLSDLPVEKR